MLLLRKNKLLRIILSSTILVIILFILLFLSKNAKLSGNIVNQDKTDLAKELYKKCKGSNDWRDCYGKEFAQIVKSKNIGDAKETLLSLQEIDKRTTDCHIIAHRMMDAIVEKANGNWKEYVSLINPSECNYGYVHGLLEGASEFDSNFHLNEKTISEICNLMERENSNQDTDQGCAHAIGHLLMAEACGEVNDALAICRKLESSLQYQCFGGVFMENFTQVNINSHCGIRITPLKEKLSEQESICKSLSGEEAKACWMETSHIYADAIGNTPSILYKSCNRSSNYEYAVACFIHITASLAIEKRADKKFHSNVCYPLEGDSKNFDLCLRAVASTLLGGSVKNARDSVFFCNSVKGAFRDSCFAHIRNFAHVVSPQDRIKICGSLPANYRDGC